MTYERTHKLFILYCNARSILPKLDHHAAICLAYNSDVVCTLEFWLCSDTDNDEIPLQNYCFISEITCLLTLYYLALVVWKLFFYLFLYLVRGVFV